MSTHLRVPAFAGYLFLFFVLAAFNPGSNFKRQQVLFPRVKAAFLEKEPAVQKLFTAQNLSVQKAQIFIRIFKQEGQLEVWAKAPATPAFCLIQTYSICAASGKPGPKNRTDDRQVPEGVYYIRHFNPQSQYHLSLGINYPNAADLKRVGKENPGGDIFIHGSCMTIGCVPLTDDKIKELYVMAVEARNAGQSQIPVHIFPARLSGTNWATLREKYQDDRSLLTFWENLKGVYDQFEQQKRLSPIRISATGQYLVNQTALR